MVGRNRAGSHGSATVEPHILYFSPVYYSMQRGVNTCDKTATMPRNSELVEAMIPALRGCGESWKTSRYGQAHYLLACPQSLRTVRSQVDRDNAGTVVVRRNGGARVGRP